MSQSAQMSRSFRFADVLTFAIPYDDESTWYPNPPGPNPRFTRGKWVYIFQAQTDGSAPAKGAASTFFGACFLDDTGAVHRVDATTARVDTDLNSLASVPATSDVSLPDILFSLPPLPRAERHCFYYFWASPVQLSTSMISLFEARISGLVPAVKLPDDAQTSVAGANVVGVIDPITIAMYFQGDYEVAATNALLHSSEAADMPDAKRAAVRRRTVRQVLGYYVKSILEADPENVLKISDKEKVVTKIRDYLQWERDELQKLVEVREVAAVRLTCWLKGRWWRLVEETHREFETLVYDQFVVHMALATERLAESSAGKAFFARFHEYFPFLVREYVLRTSPTPDVKFATVKKCGSAALAILTKLVPYIVAEDITKGGKRVIAAINFLAKAQLVLGEVFGNASFPIRTKIGFKIVSAELEGMAANPSVHLQEFKTWVKPGDKGVVNVLNALVDVTNLSVNLLKFRFELEGRGKEVFLDVVKTVGAVADVIKAKAFSGLYKLSDARAAKVGLVSAAVDIVLGSIDGVDAADAGDWGRFVGDMFLVVAGGVTAYALAAELLKIVSGSRGNYIAFIAGLVAVVGRFVVNYFSDTDLDTFVKNCVFGGHNLQRNYKPSWSLTNVDTWTDDAAGLARQLDALYRLSSAFEFVAAGPTSIKATFGNLMPESRLRLRFIGQYDPPHIEVAPEYVINPITGVVETEVGGNMGLLKATSPVIEGGRFVSYVAFVLTPPPPPDKSVSPPKPQLAAFHLWLDLFGQGENLIPETALCGRTYEYPAIFPDVFSSAT